MRHALTVTATCALSIAVAGSATIHGRAAGQGISPAAPVMEAPAAQVPAPAPAVDQIAVLQAALQEVAEGLRPEALRAALESWDGLRSAGEQVRPLLTVVDYGLPSTEKRMWVLDLENTRVLFHELVAHGRNSGDNLARAFSNVHGSYMTSLGTFVTAGTYEGRNGYSLRLRGMTPEINDQAEARAIVVHGAPYVSDSAIRSLGRLGRSHGCPAVRSDVAAELIDTIKDGSVLFAWYPPADGAGSGLTLASSR